MADGVAPAASMVTVVARSPDVKAELSPRSPASPGINQPAVVPLDDLLHDRIMSVASFELELFPTPWKWSGI